MSSNIKSRFFKEGIPNLFACKKYRIIQRITGVHYVHHVRFSYGIKMPFSNWGYFPDFHKKWVERIAFGVWRLADVGYAKTPWHKINEEPYHDCTATGKY